MEIDSIRILVFSIVNDFVQYMVFMVIDLFNQFISLEIFLDSIVIVYFSFKIYQVLVSV